MTMQNAATGTIRGAGTVPAVTAPAGDPQGGGGMSGAQHLPVVPAEVVAVLPAGGWHRVTRGAASANALSFTSDAGASMSVQVIAAGKVALVAGGLVPAGDVGRACR
jgi:hypothetical protein